MGKIRDLFKKIRDTKGPFHAKMSRIKEINGMDLTEAEDFKKRWQKHTEELYKQDLHNSDNHDGVITHLEPDILECKVKWALGSIAMNKANGGDGIPVELFQILKDDAVKVLHSICQKIWKTQQWPWTGKRQFPFLSQRTSNFQMFNLDLEMAEESEIKLPISVGSSKKQGSSRKTSNFALLTMPKPLSVWITTNCGKFKGWEYQTT